MKLNTEKSETHYIPVYINKSTSEHGGDRIDPSDRWSNRTDRVIETTYHYLSIKKDKNDMFSHLEFFITEEEAKSKFLYLATVTYTDGDTFGQTLGYMYEAGVFVDEESASNHLNSFVKKDKNKDFNDCLNWYPWDGYFSRILSYEIYKLPLVK